MPNYVIARPYAKAIFNIALESNTLQQWSDVLANMAKVMPEKLVIDFMDNPNITYEQQGILWSDIVEKFLGDDGRHFIKTLTHNHRLNIFPEIFEAYEQLRAEHENTVKVQAIAADMLTTEQQQKLETALQKRLQKKIILQCSVDKKLLGGVVIRIGDNIIDGSLRNKLNRLKNSLVGL